MTKPQLRDPGLFGSLYASAEGAPLLSSAARVKDAYRSAMNAYNWLGEPNYPGVIPSTKPRITKVNNGTWDCVGNGVLAFGKTPLESYDRWKMLRGSLGLMRSRRP